MPHGGLLPARWSSDSSLLVWEVEGKWFPMALVLMKVSPGKVEWQNKILEQAQRAILGLTKKAAPEKYAQAKQANSGNGAAYPDGFSTNVEVLGPVTLPLKIRAELASDEKAIEGHPDLNSHLEGVVDTGGKFAVKRFHLGRPQWGFR